MDFKEGILGSLQEALIAAGLGNAEATITEVAGFTGPALRIGGDRNVGLRVQNGEELQFFYWRGARLMKSFNLASPDFSKYVARQFDCLGISCPEDWLSVDAFLQRRAERERLLEESLKTLAGKPGHTDADREKRDALYKCLFANACDQFEVAELLSKGYSRARGHFIKLYWTDFMGEADRSRAIWLRFRVNTTIVATKWATHPFSHSRPKFQRSLRHELPVGWLPNGWRWLKY